MAGPEGGREGGRRTGRILGAGLSTAVPLVALLALVGTAAIPGPRPPEPRPLPAPTTTTTTRAGEEEVKQILTDLNATNSEQGLVVPLPEQVLFDFNSAEVRPDASATLAKVAQVVGFYGDAQVEVQGHTDDVGTDQYNQGLSERRANAVRDHLVTVSGIPPERLVVKAYGESRPVAPNDSEENRQRNRRVEVVILGR
ncbi:MAG TPA: OmpA family protein [Acidimicrobiales bacterium]|nr:OmpA family protein [Acidimicrobiales bacterium]